MTRKNLIGALVGAVIFTASIWGLLFWVSTALNQALWFLDALLGLYLLSKTTGNLLAARLPPPPPRAVPEPPSLWEDDDEEEIL